MKIRINKIAAVACAAGSIFSAPAVDMLTYYPNGETATPPFLWRTVENWYETNQFHTVPTVKVSALPLETQSVFISAHGGVSEDNPVIISRDETVTIKNLHIARSTGNAKDAMHGASLTVDGGTLNLSGNMYFAKENHTSGTLTLMNGALMNIAGNAELGQNNYTVGHHCRLEIDSTSKMTVNRLMTVGRRARTVACVVTNRGELVVGSMTLGPVGDSYAGTGIVHNVGCLAVSGNLDIGGYGNGGSGGASENYCKSRGELVLDENSSLQLGDNSVIYVGGNVNKSYGDGILDSSIPIVLKSGQSIKIGNAYSNALHGGVLALRKNARLDNSSSMLEIGNYQYGKAKLVMYDNASITNTGKILMANTSRVHSYIEMHGNSMITNINTIRIAQTTGTRNGSRGHIHMDGNSAIYFTPTNTASFGEGSGCLLGTTINNYAEVILKDNALLHGLHVFNMSTGNGSYEGHLRLEGGQIMFKPHTTASRPSLILGTSGQNANDGIGSISGYGTITRIDMEDPSDNLYLTMNLQMHDFSITADGDGQERDLDLRAIYLINYIHDNNHPLNNRLANWGNLSGTNGWYAVNKGRLIFPGCDKVIGKDDANPARHFGDYRYQGTDEQGNARLPALVNAFSLEPTTDTTGGKAYCHASLYAVDRTDYPRNVLRGRKGKIVSVWRIGTCTTGWTADDPITPWKYYTAMKVTFRYDQTAFDGSHPVKLYRHDGTEDGLWKCVATQSTPAENAVISATVEPGSGIYDLGWFALVEQPVLGSVISLR
ncbi:MAG: hypothetical protein IKK82_12060 [Kiritimatiellae bacterium]|nr:hypothetical protein [Kiritimatiellia bacterium]